MDQASSHQARRKAEGQVMALQVFDRGRNNVVEIDPAVLEKGSGSLTLQGNRNVVTIAASTFSVGIYGHMGNRSVLRIGANINCAQLQVHMASGSRMEIGSNVSFMGAVRLLMHEAGVLTLGDSCLIASAVDISISDMHSILDATTGQRLNPARDIRIGDRVWIGQRALIMKNVQIGSGSIVGAGAIVTRDIPANCAAAGNPARVVRENVTWDIRLL